MSELREFELVLPCYNESKSLQKIIERARTAALEFGHNETTFNLVLVENGSRDESLNVMNELKSGPLGNWFQVVPVAVNQGYGYGLSAGLSQTKSRFVAWSHADQQCDPRDAFLALEKLKKSSGLVLVKGSRFGRDWKDLFVSRFFETLASMLLGKRFHEINAQPKVFEKSLLDEIKNPPSDFAFDLYVLFRALRKGYRIETIPVEFPPRVHGLSNWSSNFFSRWKHIKNMIKYIWALSKSRED